MTHILIELQVKNGEVMVLVQHQKGATENEREKEIGEWVAKGLLELIPMMLGAEVQETAEGPMSVVGPHIRKRVEEWRNKT